MTTDPTINDRLIGLAADIVAAFVANNVVPARELPGLVPAVHAALAGLGQPQAAAAPAVEAVEKPTPAQVRKSVTPDAIISFVDGKPYKTLKRHLGTHGLDPHSYRQRFALPDDYPMVAPNYAARRSELAKSLGLGRPGARADAAEAAE